MGFSMFDFVFAIFPILFLLIFGFFLFTIFQGIRQWHYNNRQPVLTVPAKVVAKRGHVSRSMHHHDNHVHHHTGTTYYVTFEVESGDRMELQVPDQEYGLLVEGDIGRLTFQGTRFHKFERFKEQ